MTSLKCWNSGVESSGSAFILSPLGYGVSFRVPAVSEEEAASSILQVLAGKFPVGYPASNNLLHDGSEPLCFRKATSVVAKCLLVDIAEQVEGFDADVCAMQATLQKTPEVLHGVGVNVAVHVLYGVVDDGVLIIAFKTVIGFQFIAEDCSARFDAFADQWLKVFLFAGVNVPCYDLAAALHHSEHNFFALRPPSGDRLSTLRLEHIPRLATDKGFVNLDFASQFVESGFLHGKADAVQHEPRSFLGDLQSTMDLVGTDAVLATDEKPCGTEPLFKSNRGILKDSAGLEREGRTLVAGVTLPDALFGKPGYGLGAALRTLHHAVWPAQLHHELTAMLEIREPDYRVSKGVLAFHDSSMRPEFMECQVCY